MRRTTLATKVWISRSGANGSRTVSVQSAFDGKYEPTEGGIGIVMQAFAMR